MTKNRLAWDMVLEYRVNGLLSSPKSLMIDILSTSLHVMTLPMERIMGGFAMGDMAIMKEGAAMYFGYAKALKESVELGWRAMKNEKQILDPMITSTEIAQHAWSKQRLAAANPALANSSLGNAIDFMGRHPVRWAGRLRMMPKEVIDQVTYRAELRRILMKEALDKFDMKGQKHLIAKYVEDNFQAGFDAMGRGVHKEAMAFAREANFSAPLTDGLGAWIQSGKRRHPFLSLLMPFVRTPTWLFRGWVGRSLGGFTLIPGVGKLVAELNPSLKAIRADFIAGGTKRASAIGKIATGAALYGTAVVLANEGVKVPGLGHVRIIGSGPPDPRQRKILEGSGWLDNSLEITDDEGNKKYVKMDRGDPWWPFMGIAADYVQLSAFLNDEQRQDIAGFGILAFTKRLEGRLYFKGAIDAMGAFSSSSFGEKINFGENMVKSFLPRIASLEGFPGMEDKYRRDTEGVITAWQAVFPGLWDKFAPKFNHITGEPIEARKAFAGGMPLEMLSPFPYAESPNDGNPLRKMGDELMAMGPMSKYLGSTNLEDVEVSDPDSDKRGYRVNNAYQKLHVALNKLNPKRVLTALTDAKGWDQLGPADKDSVVKSTLSVLRRIAKNQLVADTPEVREAMLTSIKKDLQDRQPTSRV